MLFAASLALLLSADADAAKIAKFDALWPKRDDPAAAAELQRLIPDLKGAPDYDELWRATRWYDWMADGAEGDAKRDLGKAGWDVGELAKKLKPDGLEGKYWTSVCIGAYSEAVGILKALTSGLEPKFRDPILEVIKADPDSKAPGLTVSPTVAIGRYYDRLPWPKHSTDKAKEWLGRAIKAEPGALRAHYYLADAIKGDDKEAAKKELAFVLAGDEAYDPPEARRVKRWAKALLAQLSK